MGDCLSDETITLLIEGLLEPERLATAQAHAASCLKCSSLIIHVNQVNQGQAIAPTPRAAPQLAPVLGPQPLPDRVDHFRIIQPLGHGGMGDVYLAHDTLLDRPVAIKFIRSSSTDSDMRRRFQSEARAVARLAHPNVVSIYSMGEFAGMPYLVSEFVKGQSLDQLPRPVPWLRALTLGLDLVHGLAAAHRARVLHRDIKLANAILDEHGRARLLDFGLAKLLDDSAMLRPAAVVDVAPLSSTNEGLAVGTPRYMAPEAWRGSKHVIPPSDVYSIGVLLYELCTGSAPHRQTSLPQLYHAICNEDARPLSEVAPDVDPDLAAIVTRCLRRDAAERYPSAMELEQALERVAAAKGRAGLVAPSAPERRRPYWYQRLARRWPLLLGGTVTLCAAVWILVSWVALLREPAPGAPLRGEGLIKVPGGTFTMGSSASEIQAAIDGCRQQARNPDADCPATIFQREAPQRQVRVSSFAIDATEVTIAAVATWLNGLVAPPTELDVKPDRDTGEPRWVMIRGIKLVDLWPALSPPFGLIYREGRFLPRAGFAQRPMTHITWEGARRYCRSRGMRLPTEAEWEFAARGAEGRRYPWGDAEPRCDGVVFDRFPGGQCAHLPHETADVGTSSQDRTPLGIRDLGGNVTEWVMDAFEGPYHPCIGVCVDPIVDPSQSLAPAAAYVERGGGLLYGAVAARAAGRGRIKDGIADRSAGFRCVAPQSGQN